MTASLFARRSLSVWLVLAAAVEFAGAAEVEKRWRVSFGAGGFNPQDEVGSNAANRLLLRNPVSLEPELVFRDPRNDSAAFGNLDIQSGPVGRLDVQYALTRIFIVEGSVGYGKADIGDVEVSVEFAGSRPPIEEITNAFETFRIPAGELERVPIQFTALTRFRPRASFNPYFGAGIGYIFQGFEPTPEFNELSARMDGSLGALVPVTDSFNGSGGYGSPVSAPQDLQGAEVDVTDSFAWHVVAGAEMSFKKKWAAFLDLRWIDASRDVQLRFNGGLELGKSVPQFEDFVTSPIRLEVFGPIVIAQGQGGLIDGGQLVFVRKPDQPEGTICNNPSDPDQRLVCENTWFSNEDMATDPRLPDDFQPDGQPDAGFYFVQGGAIEHDGYQLLLGLRYTF